MPHSQVPEVDSCQRAGLPQAVNARVFSAPRDVADGAIFWGQDRPGFLQRKLASRSAVDTFLRFAMKLFLILLLVLGVVSVLFAKTRHRPGPTTGSRLPGRAFRVSLVIWLLRGLRAVVLTTGLMAVGLAFKFLLLFVDAAQAEARTWHLIKLLVLLGLIGLMLRFLYVLFVKIRTKVNKLHREHNPSADPLLSSTWSL